MDALDKALWRAEEIFLGDVAGEADSELDELLPALIEAGYVEEKPWGEDSGWFLWSFTEAGIKRIDELEAAAK